MVIYNSILLLVLSPFIFVQSKGEPSTCSNVNDASADADGACHIPQDTECELFLAPSTIPGAGLGIFVGKEIQVGDNIGYGDISIPIVDVSWHTNDPHYFTPFADYQWEGGVMGMAQDSDDADIEAFCPGLDCAINCHLGLINVGKSVPLWEEAGLHRYTSPGAGAITPYHNGTTKAIEHIPKGGELFKFYGDWWFQSRPKTFGLIPLREDHTEAEQLCDNFKQLNLTDNQAKDLWTIVKALPWESRTSNALPPNHTAALQAATLGIRSLYQPAAQKTMEQLNTNGRCLDFIRHGPSTISDAGRGAFATRYIPKGTVITGSPLLHIPNGRDFTAMYKIEPDVENPKGRWKRNLDKKVGDQVLINYCYSHERTTMFLCPYGVGVSYINHNQTMTNVKIQWTKDGELSHDDSVLQQDPMKLMFNYKIHLAMDYVATKDIKQGEELFLDYGDDWEAAWAEHVRNWKPSGKHYAPASYWNEHLADSIIRTNREQEIDPYPSNILIRAHPMLERNNYQQLYNKMWWTINEKGIHCEIRQQHVLETSEIVYDVVIYVVDDDKNERRLIRTNVPRKALLFVDVPYSTDFHQEGVFRHFLGLPEDMITDAWRNR